MLIYFIENFFFSSSNIQQNGDYGSTDHCRLGKKFNPILDDIISHFDGPLTLISVLNIVHFTLNILDDWWGPIHVSSTYRTGPSKPPSIEIALNRSRQVIIPLPSIPSTQGKRILREPVSWLGSVVCFEKVV